jgi:hypothetical protein
LFQYLSIFSYFFGKGGMSAEAYDAPLMRDLWSFKTHYVFVNVGFFGFGWVKRLFNSILVSLRWRESSDNLLISRRSNILVNHRLSVKLTRKQSLLRSELLKAGIEPTQRASSVFTVGDCYHWTACQRRRRKWYLAQVQ